MLDRKWFIASKNGKYYTRYQIVPQKQLQELYVEVERIRKAYESTYGLSIVSEVIRTLLRE